MQDGAHSSLFNMDARGDWVRLRTLVMLRWLAIAGQASAVLFATQILDMDLPLSMCALVISASVSFNVVAHIVHPAEKRLSEQGTLWSQFFDLAQLITMLMLTGGLNNPFVVLILAPVTIAATALKLRSTIWLGLVAMLSVPLMTLVHVPLLMADGTELAAPLLYQFGIGAALVIGLVFLSLYARRVTVEGYLMNEALNATQIALAREQRLAAIGGIAAAVAHELGTPLATIKLVAGELAREVEDHPELAEDIELIRSEANRCGAIMADLSQGGKDDSHVKQAPVSAIIDEAAYHHAHRGKELVVRIDGRTTDDAGEDQPTLQRSPELVHGLRNAIQNAVDFAERTVWIDVTTDDEDLRIAIGDDGPGFSPDILPRLGEPYVSSRSRGDRNSRQGTYKGMGLGLFIARTLLERTGAQLSFANGTDRLTWSRQPDEKPSMFRHPPGAIIEMLWPKERLVVPSEMARRALGENQRFSA
ncbi:MAG: ActS/PrrB/RegB family redox-sensitive histidine kinase [Pseudomonadota bacterium]